MNALSTSCLPPHPALSPATGERVSTRSLSLGEGEGRGEGGGVFTNNSRYSTVMAADSVALKPLSPVQWKARVPLSVATVENAMNGFAAIAG